MTESTLQIIAVTVALIAIGLSIHAEYLTRRTEARRRAIQAIEQERSASSASPAGPSQPSATPVSPQHEESES